MNTNEDFLLASDGRFIFRAYQARRELVHRGEFSETKVANKVALDIGHEQE